MTLPAHLLLQLADSAFPTGAFAYSNGLEALARAGRFRNFSDLENYLGSYLAQARAFDLPFLACAHAETAAQGSGEGADEALASVFLEWDAAFWNAGLRKASLRQGRVFLDLLAEIRPAPELEAFRAQAEAAVWPLHFSLALACGMACLGATWEETRWLYLHGMLRDQVAAAVRLGLLGPAAAQSLQAALMSRLHGSGESGTNSQNYREACRVAPLVDVGQGCHGFLYSRLFQN
jgi:urease accessory protein